MNLRFCNVHHHYRKSAALTDINLTFSPGITGLLGPNGAGKSTLLGLASTVLKPQSGSVHLGDDNLAELDGREAARRRLGVLPQRFTLVSSMRVLEVTTYTAWVQGVARQHALAAGVKALDAVGIGDLAEARVRSLSGGQRQRLGIAAALAHEPAVLLLDEATVALDPVARVDFRRHLKTVSYGRTVVLSTHLVEDVIHLCDRVVVLNGGSVAFEGTTQEFADVSADLDAEGDASRDGLASPAEQSYARLLRRGRST